MPKIHILLLALGLGLFLGACQDRHSVFESFYGKKTRISTSCSAWTDNCFVYCRIPGRPECRHRKQLMVQCTQEINVNPYCVDNVPSKISHCDDTKHLDLDCDNDNPL